MQTLELNKMGLAPMEQTEMQDKNGGFLPLVVVFGGWCVMAGCSLIAAGMKEALKENKKK